MKTLLVSSLLLVTTTLGALAQGQVNFSNFASGLNQPIYDTDGVTLLPSAGNLYRFDLFYGPTGSTAAQLTDAGLAASLTSNGHFSSGSPFTVPFPIFNSSNPGPVEFQVRYWQASAGATWAIATGGASDYSQAAVYAANGGTKWGFSGLFQDTPAISPTSPAVLLHMAAILPAPEPSSFILGGAGALTLLLFRRRKPAA